MSLLLLLACLRPPEVAPGARVLQSGQISLSADLTLGRTELRIHTFAADLRPLPAERQGVNLGDCATLVPSSAAEGLVLRRAEVSARCDGEALPLQELTAGLMSYTFPGPVPPGLRCEVSVDGQTVALPPLPEAPDLRFGLARAKWTPAGGDEIRVVVPRSAGRSTYCRLPDIGEGPAPRGARSAQSFASRHRLALSEPEPDGSRVAVTVTSGVWMTPAQR